MSAQVVGIGPFTGSLIPNLEYPAEYYAGTREGTTLAVLVFFIESGSTESRRMAECFSIDPWDFNQHALDPSRANLAALRDLFGDDAVQRFVALRDAGFRFFFLPNG